MKNHIVVAVLGVTLGFSLSHIGFSSYGEVRKMFTFADLRMVLVFGGALMLTIIGFALIKGREMIAPRRIHKGTILGAALFGAGWALTGVCPTIPLVQLGEGHLPAGFTFAGIVIGIKLFEMIQRRYLHWDVGSCES